MAKFGWCMGYGKIPHAPKCPGKIGSKLICDCKCHTPSTRKKKK